MYDKIRPIVIICSQLPQKLLIEEQENNLFRGLSNIEFDRIRDKGKISKIYYAGDFIVKARKKDIPVKIIDDKQQVCPYCFKKECITKEDSIFIPLSKDHYVPQGYIKYCQNNKMHFILTNKQPFNKTCPYCSSELISGWARNNTIFWVICKNACKNVEICSYGYRIIYHSTLLTESAKKKIFSKCIKEIKTESIEIPTLIFPDMATVRFNKQGIAYIDAARNKNESIPFIDYNRELHDINNLAANTTGFFHRCLFCQSPECHEEKNIIARGFGAYMNYETREIEFYPITCHQCSTITHKFFIKTTVLAIRKFSRVRYIDEDLITCSVCTKPIKGKIKIIDTVPGCWRGFAPCILTECQQCHCRFIISLPDDELEELYDSGYNPSCTHGELVWKLLCNRLKESGYCLIGNLHPKIPTSLIEWSAKLELIGMNLPPGLMVYPTFDERTGNTIMKIIPEYVEIGWEELIDVELAIKAEQFYRRRNKTNETPNF